MRPVGALVFGAMAEKYGRRPTLMLNIDEPALDWVMMAKGMGVEAARATTAEEFTSLFKAALAKKGPFLIEAAI